MLFDPNFAVPAAIDVLPARCGLIMTLEEHRTEETTGGRKSRAIANWSVEKIRAMGGDAVKVLAWYRPDADAAVNEHQKRFVREIGEQCAHHDIPYVLELWVIRSSAAPITPPTMWSRPASCPGSSSTACANSQSRNTALIS